ncbi:MAG: chromate transporter [Armatimonadetes bacterium]|nr:chromate transporter [Armatimonadota bacterium]
MRLRTLALKFLKIGATGFGGPMALIGMMHRDLVETGEVSEETFSEGVALGQMLPGPVALGCATYLGYKLRGALGATVSAGALLLPPFALMLVLSPLYLHYGTVPQVGGFFKGVGPAVIAIIIATGWRMGRKSITSYRGAIVAAAVLVAALLKLHPAILVIGGGLLGMLLAPTPRQEASS